MIAAGVEAPTAQVTLYSVMFKGTIRLAAHDPKFSHLLMGVAFPSLVQRPVAEWRDLSDVVRGVTWLP